MLAKRLLALIPFEKVEDRRVVPVAREAVVHDAFFELGEACRLFVDGLDVIGAVRVGVDLEGEEGGREMLA